MAMRLSASRFSNLRGTARGQLVARPSLPNLYVGAQLSFFHPHSAVFMTSGPVRELPEQQLSCQAKPASILACQRRKTDELAQVALISDDQRGLIKETPFNHSYGVGGEEPESQTGQIAR
jgi:hypothetical protein